MQAGMQAGEGPEAAGPVPAQAGRSGRAPARGLRPQAGPNSGQAGRSEMDAGGDRR